MITRYHTTFGESPKIEALMHLAGPQLAAEVPQEVQDICNRIPDLQQVAILVKDTRFKDRTTIRIYQPIRE